MIDRDGNDDVFFFSNRGKGTPGSRVQPQPFSPHHQTLRSTWNPHRAECPRGCILENHAKSRGFNCFWYTFGCLPSARFVSLTCFDRGGGVIHLPRKLVSECHNRSGVATALELRRGRFTSEEGSRRCHVGSGRAPNPTHPFPIQPSLCLSRWRVRIRGVCDRWAAQLSRACLGPLVRGLTGAPVPDPFLPPSGFGPRPALDRSAMPPQRPSGHRPLVSSPWAGARACESKGLCGSLRRRFVEQGMRSAA